MVLRYFMFARFTIYKSCFNELSIIMFHAVILFTEFYAHVYNVSGIT